LQPARSFDVDAMQPSDHLNILALIPAYNEAGHIASVVAGARQHLPVLVVDDGSRDATAALAQSAGATVVSQRPNAGKGAALKLGFRWAIEHAYAAVVTLDADGQHDPAEIPAFLHSFQANACDLIIGERDFSKIPIVRRISNTIGRVTFSWALGRPVRDNQSGYRLISRSLMEAMLASHEQGFQFEVEMILVCVRQKFRLCGVPIRTIYADEHSYIQPLRHILEFTRMLLRTRRAMR
jgi:glycosyltransferase involved in cell wall biosynthesis